MPNYENGKIYKMVSPSGLTYVGSTTQSLALRKGKHKVNYYRWKREKCNYVTSYELFDEAVDDIDIVLLEEVKCESKEQLHMRERYWIETTDCVNKYIPTRSHDEYYNDNKESILIQRKKYRDGKKDHIKHKNKEWYESNRDAMIQKQKEWYEANKEAVAAKKKERSEEEKIKVAQKKKAYYEANKEAIAQKKKAYHEAKKQYFSEKKKAYREANKEAIAQKQKEWYEANKDAVKQQKIAYRKLKNVIHQN
jgi:hypothetical protein